MLILSSLAAGCIQCLLIQLPPYHDIFYRSKAYLTSQPLHIHADTFSSSLVPLSWSTDWQRQLYLHPPGNYALSWIWGSLFGFSQYALGMLSIFIGWLGIVLWHRLIRNVFDLEIAHIVCLLLLTSLSFLWYSVMPVDAIFEFTIMPLGILGLFTLYESNKFPDCFAGFFLQIISLLFSYHYLITLVCSPLLVPIRKAWRQKLACLTLSFFASTLIYRGLMNGVYKNLWPHWPQRPGMIGVLTWFSELPTTVLHWGTPAVSPLMTMLGLCVAYGLCSMLFQIFFCKLVERRKKLLFLIITIFPCLLYWILSSLMGRFGHQRNLFYLLPLFYLFLILPYRNRRIKAGVVASCMIITLYSGFSFFKATITSLYTQQASLYAFLNATQNSSFDCLAIETQPIFFATNSYIQSSVLNYYHVKWFESNGSVFVCTSAQESCLKTYVYTTQDLSLTCPTQAIFVKQIHLYDIVPPLLQWILNNKSAVNEYVIAGISQHPLPISSSNN